MMFMVLIETEFYVQCREFFNGVLNNAALSELEGFAQRMRRSLFQEVLKTFEFQMVISLLLIILSPTVFPVINVPDAIRKIFMIYALGALCNSFILIFLQVLLYIGERNKALIMVIIFFSTNILFTYISIGLGENFYGAGFFLSGFVTMIVGAVFSYISYNNVIRSTFMSQPVYVNKREKIFEKVEKWVDNRQEIKDAFELKLLRNKKIAKFIKWQKPAEVVESKRVLSDIPIPVISDSGFLATYGGTAEQGETGPERVDLFDLTEIPPPKTPQKRMSGYGPYADRFIRNHYLSGMRRKSGFRR